jgi:hypothetical protein
VNTVDTSDEMARRLLEREVALIESAIRLVASGASPRTVVAGLQLADAAYPIALDRADVGTVEVETLQRRDGAGLDIVVRARGSVTVR